MTFITTIINTLTNLIYHNMLETVMILSVLFFIVLALSVNYFKWINEGPPKYIGEPIVIKHLKYRDVQ